MDDVLEEIPKYRFFNKCNKCGATDWDACNLSPDETWIVDCNKCPDKTDESQNEKNKEKDLCQ